MVGVERVPDRSPDLVLDTRVRVGVRQVTQPGPETHDAPPDLLEPLERDQHLVVGVGDHDDPRDAAVAPTSYLPLWVRANSVRTSKRAGCM